MTFTGAIGDQADHLWAPPNFTALTLPVRHQDRQNLHSFSNVATPHTSENAIKAKDGVSGQIEERK